MARGITETDVHNAADELVAAGQRPTVERIRAHLGTGSPNTVTRWLETWWKALAPRLSEQARAVAMPEAPMAVARLAQQLWEHALEVAHAQATQTLADAQAAVTEQARQMRQTQESLVAQARSLQAATEGAQMARQAAEARLADAHKLLDQQTGQLEEWRHQRDQAQQRAAALEDELAQSRGLQQEAAAAASAEREGLLAHVRTVEDRAHAQVDRARQEFLLERTELRARLKQTQAELKATQTQAEQARKAAATAQQEAAGALARAHTLEGLAKTAKQPTHARKGAALKPQGVRPRQKRA